MEDFTEEDEKEWVSSPALAPAPAPTPALEVENGPGWTNTYHFKYALDTSYYHSLLLNMLEDYYPDLNATIQLWQNLLRNRAHMHLSMSQQTSDSVHEFPTT